MSGTLYGVGIGPGDPELITRKAARLIGAAPVVAYPALAGSDSLARAIASELIPDDAEEIVIEVPMTPAREPAQAAYDAGAARIAAALESGRDVACLCEGDPLFYGSFAFLRARLKDRYKVEVVPGVTSLSACAALAGLPLAVRNGRVTVLPGPLPEVEFARAVAAAKEGTVAIPKVGRHLPKLRKTIEGLGLTARAFYVERAGLRGERVRPLASAPDTAPYFSMILIAIGEDPWL